MSTFFMKKTKVRTLVSFVVLGAIICSSQTLQLGEFSFRFTFLLLFIFSFFVMAKKSSLTIYYYSICTLIITVGYVGFHLFELFDPVWLIFNRKWMLAFAIVYLTLMLIKDKQDRIVITIIGVSNGELLYSFILSTFSFRYEIGSFQFLDSLAIMMLLIVIWNILERIAVYFEATFYKGIKERQG
uniref:YphA family membrane protein n=1 Tax=Calidifontibacillus oryziterrae TaxID=1191699 RepID=UPI001E29064B|nr:hypothetical protein [Calidifontibacillus oryziterrae]